MLGVVSLGVHGIRIPEDEWHLLGSDRYGPHEPATEDELRGDHRVHQVLPARVWRHQCEHRTRPASTVHPQCGAGEGAAVSQRTSQKRYILCNVNLNRDNVQRKINLV